MTKETKEIILEKLIMCQEIILKMHVDDENNRNAPKLKKDLQLLLKVKAELENDIVDVSLLEKLNLIYKEYKEWEKTYG